LLLIIKMARPIYGITTNPGPCIVTPPEGHDVAPYIQRLYQMLYALSRSNDKTQFLDRVDNLQTEIRTVIDNRPREITRNRRKFPV
jgi:hypothetical protein